MQAFKKPNIKIVFSKIKTFWEKMEIIYRSNVLKTRRSACDVFDKNEHKFFPSFFLIL
jgi:hypothetical protein